MEEVDELKTKAMASEPSNEIPNPELTHKPSKTREEGELSSSDDDDEHPDYSSAELGDTTAPPAGPSSVPPVNKANQGIHTGPTGTQLRTTLQSGARKNNEVPPRSAVPGWSASVGANNGANKNLVISFSDGDSGSDSEEYRQDKALHSKVNTTGWDGNQRPPVSSLAKSNKLQNNTRFVNKAMPKKVSLSRTFISSMTKIHGSNTRGTGPSSLGQGSRARNLNNLNRNLASREHAGDLGLGPNDTKLQDLRQQIALRENELKLKATQQNKESASLSGRYQNTENLKNGTATKSFPISSRIAQLESKEPDRKRLKVGGSYSTLHTFGGQTDLPTAKSTLPLKEPTMENYSLQESKVDRHRKGIPYSRAESDVVRWQRQHENQRTVSSQGAGMNTSCNQSDRSSKQVDTCVTLNQSVVLDNGIPDTLPKKSSNLELSHPPGSFWNKPTTVDNLKRLTDHHEVISRDKTPEHSFNDIHQEHLNNANFWSYAGNANLAEHSNIDIQSLFEMEELVDKELQEAQEHRHKCEIEERNALKAYRKAQRDLFKANAQCTDLYHKREFYSGQLRSSILNTSNLVWSSEQHDHARNGLDHLSNMSKNGYLIPISSHQRQPKYNGINQAGYDSSIRDFNNVPTNTSYQHMNGQNLGSEPCSEPDASTSEAMIQRAKNTAHGAFSPSIEPDISANEDEETSPEGHASFQQNNECQRTQKHSTCQMDIDNRRTKGFSADSSQDSLLLEETLRSELFARLGTRALSKSSSTFHNTGPFSERGAENDIGNEKVGIHNEDIPFSGAENEKSDLEGNQGQERSVPVGLVQNQQRTDDNCLNGHNITGCGDNRCSDRQHQQVTKAVSISPLIYRSAFSHLMAKSRINSEEMQTTNPDNQNSHVNNTNDVEGAYANSDGIHKGNMLTKSTHVTVRNLDWGESSYTCSPSVDPFWPLCMYELRGKCNDEACPWQHGRDYCDGNMDQHQRDDSNNADCQAGLIIDQQKCHGATEVPKNHNVMILPTYLVGLDILRADSHSYRSILAYSNSQRWQKCFSFSLATSNLLRNGFSTDRPFLHGGDGRIEVHGTLNKQLSYFQRRSGLVNPIDHTLADRDQALEMALTILNQEVTKLEGVRKALFVLSRSLETDPSCVILWIVYLIIYYGNSKPFGKDDMYLYAVKHNEGSYVLWLMYINSRRQLDDRLTAYDAGLSALCRHASASDMERTYASACILDLFLQMMDCLCMSGNAEKAIQRSYGLFPSITKPDQPHLSLSDLLTCLTISEKCVFWVCCIYLVIYRKLPDAVVQRFECQKELLEVEWPSVHLTEEGKQTAVNLVETAVESVDSYIYCESAKSEVNLRSAQLFAINHIRCMVALDSLECWKLLDKYNKLYPSCIELVILSARTPKPDLGGYSFVGFEEVLSQWPKEVPGIQFIWYQYIEYVLQNGRVDFAKELMARWFHSVWRVQCPQNGVLDATDSGNLCGSLGPVPKSVQDSSSTNPDQMDIMFGYLNLALHKILQNDHMEAHIAVDNAMKAAISENLEDCTRKHVKFLLSDASLLAADDGPVSGVKKILEIYLGDPCRAFSVSEPLARKFINDIKKPRVRQLVSGVLSPVSFDCSLVNLILELWYGPSLLPKTFSDSKYLVDFVEAILEVVPSNFHFAISVCKLLSKSSNSTNITSTSLRFWACSTLVNVILDAIPIPPEYVWVEAGCLLHSFVGTEAISRRFYKRALSVYPFSIRLWKSFYNLSKATGDASDVVEAAKEKGVKLD
ncbi:putative Zinc finger C3H1 domain-containing protein [Quillaja saponaria]|uniref:Zinc finger C3H1 domain-containing protein n=1 Tax=Quillaja saponaria TaxID=32244 RepID=A0AAD7PY34_QUISA|nr:putative Zinc finger C3H1 domain-containing protein [Quillaja saponaria]